MMMTGGEYMSPDRLLLHKIRKNDQTIFYVITGAVMHGYVISLGIKDSSDSSSHQLVLLNLSDHSIVSRYNSKNDLSNVQDFTTFMAVD